MLHKQKCIPGTLQRQDGSRCPCHLLAVEVRLHMHYCRVERVLEGEAVNNTIQYNTIQFIGLRRRYSLQAARHAETPVGQHEQLVYKSSIKQMTSLNASAV